MLPSVVVTNSFNGISPDRIIKEILDVADLSEPEQSVLPGLVRSYPWHVITKYYEADILLCTLEQKSLGNQEFADSVNALIIPFDSTSTDGLKVVEQWYTFSKEFDAEVKILVCETCRFQPEEGSVVGVTRLDAETWCIENGFELVELSPQEDEPDPDVEDMFIESTGIKRIIQALHAHTWPNLEMLDSENNNGNNGTGGLFSWGDMAKLLGQAVRNPLEMEDNTTTVGDNESQSIVISSKERLVAAVKPTLKESPENKQLAPNVAVVNPTVISPIAASLIVPSTDVSNAISMTNTDSISSSDDNTVSTTMAETTLETRPSPVRDERINVMLEAMDSLGEDSFEELFQNLSEMKSKAESLSPSQRKAYAEKMTIAFCKAIGGMDSEIEGLSSGDED